MLSRPTIIQACTDDHPVRSTSNLHCCPLLPALLSRVSLLGQVPSRRGPVERTCHMIVFFFLWKKRHQPVRLSSNCGNVLQTVASRSGEARFNALFQLPRPDTDTITDPGLPENNVPIRMASVASKRTCCATKNATRHAATTSTPTSLLIFSQAQGGHTFTVPSVTTALAERSFRRVVASASSASSQLRQSCSSYTTHSRRS